LFSNKCAFIIIYYFAGKNNTIIDMERALQLDCNNTLLLSEIDSTNTYIKQQVDKGLAMDGMLVQARQQSSGKGQQSNSWISQNGKDLLFSGLFMPKKHINISPFLINMAISIGVRNYVAALLPAKNIYIKWSNDILVEKEKIAGILIENTWQGNGINTSIIGIGININSIIDKQLLPHATSIIAHKHTETPLNIIDCLEHINGALQILKTDTRQILRQYNSHLYKRNKISALIIDTKIFEGEIIEVLENGHISVLIGNNTYNYEYGSLKIPYSV
jgi:BirA family transcriptional regulator, biotin operon repressor / biotin---[acetyl-CoA-carboxylase] ligase